MLTTLGSCSQEEKITKLFEMVPSEQSGIHFINEVKNTEDFNIFSYRNFYNGGGVAMGDINNDGLTDIYFTNNMGQNKLFLNQGNFKFSDITDQAKVGGTKAWSTGVVMVDINNDRLLDIYVCNAGYVKGKDQENELFINNGDLTFTEKASDYQLNENGYTTHAAFFDYDLDGDLDAYILNNSFIPVNTLNYSNKRELNANDWPVRDFLKGGGDKLLRNDDGKFSDVSEEAGIYGSLIGFGLGITVGDINDDQLPDLYVSNDFFERDYLYVNQGDGTFKEDIKNWMEHLSLSSMGADMADINNDGFPEIFVTEMLPDDEYRLKTKSSFENYNTYLLKQQRDFYHQYMHNTLQFNNKDKSFSEISWYSGVSASDWSWGALMFDADNDGYRDIYVCNGVYQDVTDQDFIDFFANDVIQKMALTGKKEEMEKVIDRMPSNPLLNKVFKNNQDLTFEDIGPAWGFDEASFSNGAAYGDLDNDGDLDLVVNNLNQQAFVFRNNAQDLLDHHYLSISLKGSPKNTYAIGSKVYLFRGQEIINFQLIPTRGFQSSVDYKMVFGLGQNAVIDSLVILWPDKSKSIIQNPAIDTTLSIDYNQINKLANGNFQLFQKESKPLLEEVDNPFIAQQEDAFIDFYQEGLTMRMLSKEGPKAVVGDVNGDGLEDVFIGGASGTAGQLYLQQAGGFSEFPSTAFAKATDAEDTAVCFFDADGDGDADLYVGSGGNRFSAGSREMQDRIYLNDGQGNFSLKPDALPVNGLNTGAIVPLDFDGDGDLDIFVGSRSIPGNYGVPPRSYLYENDGQGKFASVAKTKAPDIDQLGMVTSAQLVNVVGDETPELIVVGEWMSPKVFEINNGQLKLVSTDLDAYSGWWYTIEAADLDGDGDQDLVLGNRGENFYFTGSPEKPLKLWLKDFDNNGTVEKIITRTIDGKDMTVALKKELTSQIVSLKKQSLKHTEFAAKSIQDLFPKEILEDALMLEGNYFKTTIAINEGNGKFTLKPLPKEVQFSCVCGIYCADLNGDAQLDLVMAGNDSGFLPQFSKLDASFGHVLINQGNGDFSRMENRESGFFIRGDVKQFVKVTIGGEPYLLATINEQKPKLFKVE
ncbi:MAG: hypothetical protein DHS20C18_33930 [Saprospiraceae bacterium]|nr:MAG: hypothetical protein DHS20C18_33930 [Saprospiraceae bacterium]